MGSSCFSEILIDFPFLFIYLGISRGNLHKRRSTGAKRTVYRKPRKYELGRQPANTKIGPKRIHDVRCRGGIIKHRALRLDMGNFSWGSEATTKKTRIISVAYNASNNELVRTNTLVKGSIILIDATPFRQWYEAHYGLPLGKKAKKIEAEAAASATSGTAKKSSHVIRKLEARRKHAPLDPLLEDQFNVGRLYACITSRPGQSGRCDGYIVEGKELEFYTKKLKARKG